MPFLTHNKPTSIQASRQTLTPGRITVFVWSQRITVLCDLRCTGVYSQQANQHTSKHTNTNSSENHCFCVIAENHCFCVISYTGVYSQQANKHTSKHTNTNSSENHCFCVISENHCFCVISGILESSYSKQTSKQTSAYNNRGSTISL